MRDVVSLRLVALALALLAPALLVGACAPLPTPFKDGAAKQSALHTVALRAAPIVVAPAEGGPPGVAGPMADAIVDGLIGMGIAATGDIGLSEALLLEGQFIAPGAIRWRLSAPDGSDTAVFVGPADSGAVETVLDRVRLVYRMGGEGDGLATGEQLAPPEPLRVAFGRVSGAPGDGDTALARAMRGLLDESGLRLTQDQALADVVLDAEVSLEPAGEGSERIRIVWILRDPAESGQGTLARLEQDNVIPAGSLSDRWGGTAYDAALAALGALGETLAILDESHGRQAEAAQR
jgi:hypothetical protein